jgi:hypothetical protein
MIGSNSRLVWIIKQAPFASRRARLRGFWHYIMRGYQYEICKQCGRPVGPHTGSWWYAPTNLWAELIGEPIGTLCPPCFTAAGDAVGISIYWRAVRDQDIERNTDEARTHQHHS